MCFLREGCRRTPALARSRGRADTEVTPVSRTMGADQLVDEMIFKFTHTMRMDWMLPGIPPTGKRVEVPLIASVIVNANNSTM
jgi:hypothetical protein